jgi:tetratricopeptide (TPR) repeat protein
VLAYNNRGTAWSAKQEYEKALADFGEAIRLDPKFARAYCNRGVAYSNKGNYDKAIGDFTEVIRLDPKSAFAYLDVRRFLAAHAARFTWFFASFANESS